MIGNAGDKSLLYKSVIEVESQIYSQNDYNESNSGRTLGNYLKAELPETSQNELKPPETSPSHLKTS